MSDEGETKIVSFPGNVVTPKALAKAEEDELREEVKEELLRVLDEFRAAVEAGQLRALVVAGVPFDGHPDQIYISSDTLSKPAHAVGVVEIVKNQLLLAVASGVAEDIDD